jgi:hypothetical protein
MLPWAAGSAAIDAASAVYREQQGHDPRPLTWSGLRAGRGIVLEIAASRVLPTTATAGARAGL